ncbi:hypothetical protein COO60DRAFT_319816 [Scenedesmus sp. NREL 46B-D3]|nr:hypothetical protein COO60DRAFT_319816 [Scenedesmus sp. NREL 46B-D3]
MRLGAKQPALQQQVEEPGSPSVASVEGSTTASQSASLGPASNRQDTELLATLSSKASDHIDRAYHSNVNDMLAQTTAEAAAGGKRGKKKKGVKVDLSSLQEMGTEQYGRPQQQQPLPQQQQPHLPSPAGRQQQQQQQAQVSMADFPSLDEAAFAQAAGDEMPPEKDYLAEALNQLKLGIGEAQHTQHVLVEGLNFHEMRREGLAPRQVVEQLVLEKCNRAPVAVLLFERQNAAAVVLPDRDAAVQLSFLVHGQRMYRKLLIPSFLREAPYDDVLHEACPDYEPESIRQRREHDEAMRDLNAASAAAGGIAVVTEDRIKQLSDLVKDGKLSQEALMEILNRELGQQQQQQQQQQQNGASSSSAAAGSHKQPSMNNLHEQQRPAAGAAAGRAVAAKAGATAGAAAAAGATTGCTLCHYHGRRLAARQLCCSSSSSNRSSSSKWCVRVLG